MPLNQPLTDYLLRAHSKLPPEALSVLSVLILRDNLNKEELSLQALVKRNILDNSLMMLTALELVDIVDMGKSRVSRLTPLGRALLQIMGGKAVIN